MRKILVTGCGGMVGSAVYPYLKDKGYDVLATDKDVNEPWLKYLDVRDKRRTDRLFSEFNPEVVINLAALTSLEYCENNIEEAYKVNYIAPRDIASLCIKIGAKLVHIGTAGVFDGEKEEYCETDLPNPLNIYGKTKFYGENAVRDISDRHFIVRPGWMFGGGIKDKKFVSYIMKQIQEGNRVFNVVNDKFGTPTYTRDLAKNIELIFNTENYGLYHMVCKGRTNRLDMTKHILELLRINNTEIKEVNSDFFNKDFPVRRANCEILLSERLDSLGLNVMSHWKEALRDYILRDWSNLIRDN